MVLWQPELALSPPASLPNDLDSPLLKVRACAGKDIASKVTLAIARAEKIRIKICSKTTLKRCRGLLVIEGTYVSFAIKDQIFGFTILEKNLKEKQFYYFNMHN